MFQNVKPLLKVFRHDADQALPVNHYFSDLPKRRLAEFTGESFEKHSLKFSELLHFSLNMPQVNGSFLEISELHGASQNTVEWGQCGERGQ